MTFTIKQLYLDANLHVYRTINDINILERLAIECFNFISLSSHSTARFNALKIIGRITTSLKRKYHDVRLAHKEVPWSYFDLLATLGDIPPEGLMEAAPQAVQALYDAISPESYKPGRFLLTEVMPAVIEYMRSSDESVFKDEDERLSAKALIAYLKQEHGFGEPGYLFHETMTRLLHQFQVRKFMVQFCEAESCLLHCQLEIQGIYFELTKARNEQALEAKHSLFKQSVGAFQQGELRHAFLAGLSGRVDFFSQQLEQLKSVVLLPGAGYNNKFVKLKEELIRLQVKTKSFFGELVSDLLYLELLQIDVFLSGINHNKDISDLYSSINSVVDVARYHFLSEVIDHQILGEKGNVVAQRISTFFQQLKALAPGENIRDIVSVFKTHESVLESFQKALSVKLQNFITEILGARKVVDDTDISREVAGSYRNADEISVHDVSSNVSYVNFQVVLTSVFLQRHMQLLSSYRAKLTSLLAINAAADDPWVKHVAMLNCMVIIGETFKELANRSDLRDYAALISPFIGLRSAILHAVHENPEQRQALFALISQAPEKIMSCAKEYLVAVDNVIVFLTQKTAFSRVPSVEASQIWQQLKLGKKVDEEALLYPVTSINFLLDRICHAVENEASHDAAGLVLAWIGQLALDVTEKSYVHGRTLSRHPDKYQKLIENLGHAALLRANFCHGFAERLYLVHANPDMNCWEIKGADAALGFVKAFRKNIDPGVFLDVEGEACYRRVLHDVNGNNMYRTYQGSNVYISACEEARDISTRPPTQPRIKKMLTLEREFLLTEKNTCLAESVCQVLNEVTDKVIANDLAKNDKAASPVSVVVDEESVTSAFHKIFSAYKTAPWHSFHQSAEKVRVELEGLDYFSKDDFPVLADQFGRLMCGDELTPEKVCGRESRRAAVLPGSPPVSAVRLERGLFSTPSPKKSNPHESVNTGDYKGLLGKRKIFNELLSVVAPPCGEKKGVVGNATMVTSSAFYAARNKSAHTKKVAPQKNSRVIK